MVGVSSDCFFQFMSFMLLAMQFAELVPSPGFLFFSTLPLFLCLPIRYFLSLSLSLSFKYLRAGSV